MSSQDPFDEFRACFHIPQAEDGQPLSYLCGHSLGLQPKTAKAMLSEVMNDWASMAVEKWFSTEKPWFQAGDRLRPQLARLVGAKAEELTVMNSLTVNMHLLLSTFYRPQGKQRLIITDAPTFPSDLHALRSQIALHGGDPEHDLIQIFPRQEEATLRLEDIQKTIQACAGKLALLWFSGVNFLTGQLYPLEQITQSARKAGAFIGLDLAHAIGNVPLHLHDWGVDCAVWCHYKYLNSGPGSVGGAYIHECHYLNSDKFRLAGWWGDSFPARFDRHMGSEHIPEKGANGWQLSTPSPLQLSLLQASLEIFEQTGMERLRARSELLTGTLEEQIRELNITGMRQLTPKDPRARGAQLSFSMGNQAMTMLKKLRAAGIVCDLRAPDVIRIAPCPLYNDFGDVERCISALQPD